jgi:hypothetical protein
VVNNKEKGIMIKFMAHSINRTRELGPLGTFQRIWERISNPVVTWGQSQWWGWKARQVMSDGALLRRTTGEWSSVEALITSLANRPPSSFLFPFDSPKETALLLNHYYPEYISSVMASVNAICHNELVLLGKPIHFLDAIDWNRDPVTGYSFPLLHRNSLNQYLKSNHTIDLIYIWEMNRHQHFIKLGIAYWLTGDQRYVDTFCSQIKNWIETNPLQHGVNWYYGLEVSVRLLAWTAAFQFFCTSLDFQKRVGNAFLKYMWLQADFVVNHLQTTWSDVPNNHMIAELATLALVGAAFPEFRNAVDWRETGLRMLNQQVIEQIYSDGVSKEQAIGYHRFIVELLLLVVARGRQGKLSREPILEQTLERMLDYLLFTMTPVGTVPLWGDSDFGRILVIGKDRDFWNFLPILSAGAALFDRAEWKYASGCLSEEAFWLLGPDGLKHWDQLEAHRPMQTSRAFPEAGLYIIRDSWNAETDVAFFRCGTFGLGGEGHCAHAHCDLLSFTLWVNGQPLLVDSGTYTYKGPMRDIFRLTMAHNTVMVDGRDQAAPKQNFNWSHIPEGKCVHWSGESVTGAIMYPGPVEFNRELVQVQPGLWELVDKFFGGDEHTIEWSFHFAPGLDLRLENEARILTILKDRRSYLIVVLPNNGIRFHVRDGWYSYQYGVKQRTRGLLGQWHGKLNVEGVSFHFKFQLINTRS